MIVRTNDIIISTTRPHRGAIALIDENKDKNIASTGFAIIRELKTDKINRKYLFFILRSSCVLQQFQQRSSGGNYPAITQDELKKVLIPVPNNSIQTQIIEKLDFAYSQKQKFEKESDSLQTFEYLLAKLSPKLLQLSDKKSFSVRVSDLQDNRADVFFHLPKFKQVEDYLNSFDFKTIKLKDTFLQSFVKGILPNEDEKKGDLKVLQIKNIGRNGFIDTSFNSTGEINVFEPKHKLEINDIVIVITGATIGKVGIWTDTANTFYLGGDMVKFQTNSNFNPYFVWAYLQTTPLQILIKRNITGATNGHLAPKDIENLPIPCLPIELQNELANEIKERFEKSRELKEQAQNIVNETKQEIEKILFGA